MTNFTRFAAMAMAAAFVFTNTLPADAATRRYPHSFTPDATSTTQHGGNWFGGSNLSSAARAKVNELSQQSALTVIPVPVLLGIEVGSFTDTWGEARADGRTHEGTDILAPKDAYVVAPADSVVSQTGFGANGGNFVYTINPGGERYYFAHLDRYAAGLEAGTILKKGDLIGYVGNTGNASGGPPHLHFCIYASGAQNPFPRLTKTFSDAERVDAVAAILNNSADSGSEARVMVGNYVAFFRRVVAVGLTVPKEITQALGSAVTPSAAVTGGGVVGSRNLTVGFRGTDVVLLQTTLIAQHTGPAATALAAAGATGYFGNLTKLALAEYQVKQNISPAVGYFGPITRAKMAALALLTQ